MQQEMAFLRAATVSTARTQPPLENENPVTFIQRQTKETPAEKNVEKISTLHIRLKQEADKIRRWKVETELDLRQKEKKIQEASVTIDSLRKSILDLQIQNENLSTKLQEEIDKRSEITESNAATRDMCNILKDYASKVEGRLQKCEAAKTEIKCKEKNTMEQFEKLSEQFKHLEITTSEMYNKLKNEAELEKQIKMDMEKSYKIMIQKTELKLQEMTKICENQSDRISSLTSDLEHSRVDLNNIQDECAMIQNQLALAHDESVKRQEELQVTHSEMQALKVSYMQEIDQLKIERESLHKTINLQKEEIGKLEGDIKVVQDKLCKVEKELTCKTKLVEDLTTETKILTQQVTEYQQDLEHTKEELRHALEKERASYDKIDSLKAELREERENLRSEEYKLKEERSEKQLLLTELNTVKKETKQLMNKLENYKRNETELLQQNNELSSEIDKLRKDIQELKVETKHKSQEANRLQDELSRIANLKNDLDEKNRLLTVTQDKYQKLMSELDHKNTLIHDLEMKLSEMGKTLEQIKEEKGKSDKDHEAHVKELVTVFEKYKKMGDDLALDQQKEIERLRNALEEAQSKNTEVRQLKTMLDKTTSQMSDMENDKNEKICSLKQQLAKLSADFGAQQRRLAEKEHEIQCYKEKEAKWKQKEETHEDLIKKERKLQKQVDKLKEELKALKNKDKDNSEVIKEMEKDKVQLQKLKKEYEDKYAKLEIENKKLVTVAEENSRNLDELKKFKQTVMELQSKADKLEKELEEMKRHKITNSEKATTGCKESIMMQKSNFSEAQLYVKSPLKGKNESSCKSDYSAKKRRVMFQAAGDHHMSDSSVDLVEIEADEIETFNLNVKTLLTPKTPLKPVPRGPPASRTPHSSIPQRDIDKKRKEDTPKSNVRRTPKKPQAKFFKSPPNSRKKKQMKEDTAWFDNDTVFGFDAED